MRTLTMGNDGNYFPNTLHTDQAIPPVSAGGVRAAAEMVAGYAERRGLTTDDVVELLAMLRINRDTLEHGLHASETVERAS